MAIKRKSSAMPPRGLSYSMRLTALRLSVATGEKSDRYPGHGSRARIVTLGDGSTAVRKTGDQDQELLASLVGDALGLYVPAVLPLGAENLHMEFVEGDLAVSAGDAGRQSALASMDSKIAALFDQLIGNTDRHSANWIVRADGIPVPIDHGYAFWRDSIPREPGGIQGGDFMRATGHTVPHFHAATWDLWRERLDTLSAPFAARGRGSWHAALMRELEHWAKLRTAEEGA